MADLNAGGQLVAGSLIGTGRPLRLIEQIFKFNLGLLVAGRIDVREIVGNHIQVVLLGVHSGSSGVKCANHGELVRYAGLGLPSSVIARLIRSSLTWTTF